MRLQIAGVFFLVTMFYLASQGDRHKNTGITQIEKRNIEEAEITRQVAHIKERDRKRELKRELESHHPYPRAQNLDDGTQGDKSIMELMDGFRGFL
jgi:hypothetical protein